MVVASPYVTAGFKRNADTSYLLPSNFQTRSTIFIGKLRQNVCDEDRHREFPRSKEAFMVSVHQLLPFLWQCMQKEWQCCWELHCCSLLFRLPVGCSDLHPRKKGWWILRGLYNSLLGYFGTLVKQCLLTLSYGKDHTVSLKATHL